MLYKAYLIVGTATVAADIVSILADGGAIDNSGQGPLWARAASHTVFGSNVLADIVVQVMAVEDTHARVIHEWRLAVWIHKINMSLINYRFIMCLFFHKNFLYSNTFKSIAL